MEKQLGLSIDGQIPNRPQSTGFPGKKLDRRIFNSQKDITSSPSNIPLSPYQYLLKAYQAKEVQQKRYRIPASEFQPYELEFDAQDNLLIHNFMQESSRRKQKHQTQSPQLVSKFQSSQPHPLDLNLKSTSHKNVTSEPPQPMSTQTEEDDKIFLERISRQNFIVPSIGENQPIIKRPRNGRCMSSAFYKINQSMKRKKSLNPIVKTKSEICTSPPILNQLSRQIDMRNETQPNRSFFRKDMQAQSKALLKDYNSEPIRTSSMTQFQPKLQVKQLLKMMSFPKSFTQTYQ